MMSTLTMHCMWLGSELTLTLLISMIMQHYRHIIMHYKYVHNALQVDPLSNVLPNDLTSMFSYVFCLFKHTVGKLCSACLTVWHTLHTNRKVIMSQQYLIMLYWCFSIKSNKLDESERKGELFT